MRMIFHPDGSPAMFYLTTPKDPAPDSYVTIDVEAPDYFAHGALRAWNAGRVTYQGGKVCLDGAPYTLPTFRWATVTYGQALGAIASASTAADLRDILLRVADLFLKGGEIEL